MVIPDPKTIRRILVIKLRAVGDVVLSTVVLRNLRVAFPSARLDVLTEKGSASVVQGNPDVDGTIVFDRATMSGVRLIHEVRSSKYDLVLDLFGNPRTALATRMSGAHYRVGFRFRGRTYAYNLVVEPRGGEVHNTQFNLDLLEALGVPITDRSLRFPVSTEDRLYVDAFLDKAGLGSIPLVALCLGGGWYTKRWGIDHFALLGDRLAEKHGLGVVIPWGPGEEAEVELLRTKMKFEPFVPPPTSLPQLGALLDRCRLAVCNDSGPMHIAAAMKTPVVAIFGPTRPELQGPYGTASIVVRREGLDCLGCNLTKCPIGNPCMIDLSVESVVKGVDDLLLRISTEGGRDG
jgi:heptosyltransferase III